MSFMDHEELARLLGRLDQARDDQDAWRSLHGGAWPLVVAIAARRLRNATLAEDAAQEVFLRLLRYAPFSQLQDPNRFRAYLATVAKHVADTHLRRLLGRQKRERPIANAASVAGQDAAPEDAATGKELAQQIRQQLSRDDRRLLELLLEGCELPEIATVFGIGYGAAATRLNRLRVRIRNLPDGMELGSKT